MIRKIIKWTIIVLVSFVVVLAAVPFLFKDKIVQAVKDAANSNLEAEFDFKSVDLSLLRSFPRLSVTLEGLKIVNKAPFNGDTLVYAGEFSATLDVMSVIKGEQISVRTISISDAYLNFQVTENGKASWDIAKPSAPGPEPEQPSRFKASIDRYTLSRSRIRYDDRSLGFLLSMETVEHSGKGDFTQDLFTLSTTTAAEHVRMVYDKIPYIADAKTTIDADLEMDMKQMKFSFKQNKVQLNELSAMVDGFVAMPDTNIDMALKFAAPNTDFKTLLSLVPALYSKDFSGLTASGKVSLDGHLTGRYNAVSMPGFGLNLSVEGGKFKYPSLPSDVKDVSVELKVENPDGVPDHTEIRLSKLHADLGGNVIDARLFLTTPVSDPNMDFFLKGTMDLANVGRFYPLEKETRLSGVITADAAVKGRLSAMQAQKFDQFSAAGNVSAKAVDYSGPAAPKPLSVSSMALSLDTRQFTLSELDMKAGTTRLSASGALRNVIGYVLKDQTVEGELSVSSPFIDLDEWMSTSSEDSAVTDTVPMSVFEVPKNIRFSLKANVDKLHYDNLDIAHMRGAINLGNEEVRMSGVYMELMGGSMKLDGAYSSADLSSPSISFDFAISDFDIQETVKKFNTVEKMAPLAKHCVGRFGVAMDVKGRLDQKMDPIINTLSGSGKLNTSKVVVSGFPAFDKAAELLKNPSFKRIEIPSMNPSFRFLNGRVYVDPFDVKLNDWKARIGGSNGFDQTIDYTVNVDMPRSTLGSSANAAIDNLVAQANAKGASIQLGEVIPVALTIKGTVKDPKVSTDLNRQGAKAMDQLKAAAAAEFEKQKAAAEARAREEADRLKAEADARLKAEKEKAQREADRIKREAEAKAKATADSIKKAAQKEAKKAIDQFNPFKK